MSTSRKRLKLSPPHIGAGPRTEPPDPPAAAHNAPHPLLPPAPGVGAEGRGVAEEEEEEGYLLVEEDTTDSSLVITMEESQREVKGRKKGGGNRKRRLKEEEEEMGASESEEEETGGELEIDRQLDQALETKSKQHNLTTVNVRNIIHEVITNEHVVAMMKAAINETEAIPPFEPKMTRSKFKEVVEKGVVIPAWNISPIKKTSEVKAPQFVDIPLAEEDSSDEEYRPDEEEEDETAEDTLQESDMDSTTSSPRGSRGGFIRTIEDDSCSPWQSSRHRFRHQPISMGPPPPPQAPPIRMVTDRMFLEKLNAVEEELAICMEPYQPISRAGKPLSEHGEMSMMACRTRSKRTLRDVPLGRLEAELRAPDITPDMYDLGSAHEDREWTDWLRGLMSSDVENEEEGDDDDDPEYNFLADTDEPDREDYRNDKAVRITKKEVNELMEELFETLKDDLAGQDLEDEGHEEEEETQDDKHGLRPLTLLTHTTIEVAEPMSVAEEEPISEFRTVKEELAYVKKRRELGLPVTTMHPPEPFTLTLDPRQRAKLQQQVQQHVQLLTQIHMLTRPVAQLQSEAHTTRQFLFELQMLAQRGEMSMADQPAFSSAFRVSNLQGALELLEELRQAPVDYQHHRTATRRTYPVMPAELAWLFATRPVFLYAQLLPCASLDPAFYCPRRMSAFTAAEDCLLVLGLRDMEGTCDQSKMVSQFLLKKTTMQVRRRILQCCRPGFPDNIVKTYRYQKLVQPMPLACGRVEPGDQRPPVERDERILPLWLARSLPVMDLLIKQFNCPSLPVRPLVSAKLTRSRRCHRAILRSGRQYSFPPGTLYPPWLPTNMALQRMGFVIIEPPHAAHSFLPPSTLPPCSSSSSSRPQSCDLSLSVAVTHSVLQQTGRPAKQSHSKPGVKPSPELCAKDAPKFPKERPQKSLRVVLCRLPPSAGVRDDSAPTVRSLARDQIALRYRTFATLRRLPRSPPSLLIIASPRRANEAPPHMSSTPVSASNQRTHSAPIGPSLSPINQSLAGGRRRNRAASSEMRRRQSEGRDGEGACPPWCPPEPLAPTQQGSVVMRMNDGEEEEEERGEEGSDVEVPHLALSESSAASQAGSVTLDLSDPGGVGSEEEEEDVTLTPSPGQRRRAGKASRRDEREEGMMSSSDESTLSVPELQETMERLSWLASEGTEEERLSPPPPLCEEEEGDCDEDDFQREQEDVAFAQDYLDRVCEAVLDVPGRAESFLSVVCEFEQQGAQASPVELHGRLRAVLEPWPLLLRDYAAFLTGAQARLCGLLAEQQLFERSRQFLRQLGRSLGEGSTHYQEVVAVLQGGPARRPSGIKKIKAEISSLLKDHAHLQEEFWVFFNELHRQSMSTATRARAADANSISQNSTSRNRNRGCCSQNLKSKRVKGRTVGSEVEEEERGGGGGGEEDGEEGGRGGKPGDEEEKEGRGDREAGENREEHPVCAKNISLTPSGEKVVLWTREADRAILTACQQRGAKRKTFRLVSAQLGDKTAQQVGIRFKELMTLFHSAVQKHTSCSTADHPISCQEAAPD